MTTQQIAKRQQYDIATFDNMNERMLRQIVAIGISFVLGEPVQSVATLATRGRVAVVAVDPYRNTDPIMPIILVKIPGDWHGCLRNWWLHQLLWPHMQQQKTQRQQWLRDGRELLSRLLDYVKPYLTQDEFLFLSFELATALATPEQY